MARTADELAEESSESEGEGQGVESSDEEEGVPYNPKNLPLGWDGKPIPYWLYKLHGLNVSYSCEICGNATYRGPKAFQRHFSVSAYTTTTECCYNMYTICLYFRSGVMHMACDVSVFQTPRILPMSQL